MSEFVERGRFGTAEPAATVAWHRAVKARGHVTNRHARPRVVCILPRGEAIRNFVYTGALDRLRQENELVLLSVLPNGHIADLLGARSDRLIPLTDSREDWAVRVTRELLDMAHGRWLWSQAAQERWRLRDTEADTIPKYLKRSVKKLACMPLSNRPGLEFLARWEERASVRSEAATAYLDLFEQLRPSLVFNGSHVHSRNATLAVHAARALGIPTATFIFSWDNLTSQGRIIPPYDHYLVWNEGLREQLLSIYRRVRPEQVFVTGTPQFDFHFRPEFHLSREDFCARVGADPDRPLVLYSTGMPNHMPGEPELVEELAHMLRDMEDAGSPQLLVRVYPKDRTNRFDRVKRENADILFPEIPWEAAWHTPLYEDSYLLTNMLRHAALGVNVASTVSLELCMFDKPVINVGYNPPGVDRNLVDYSRYYLFDHYRPIVASDAVEVAYSPEELRDFVTLALREPQRRAEARKHLVARFFGGTLDGLSGQRVASVLHALAESSATTGLIGRE